MIPHYVHFWNVVEMTDFYWLRWDLTDFFCLGWPQTSIFPISTFQVVGITGVRYHAWPQFLYYLAPVPLLKLWLRVLFSLINHAVTLRNLHNYLECTLCSHKDQN
jgi:hypothetical protein